MAVVAAPENPAELAVRNVPFIVTACPATSHPIEVVQASNIDPAAMVNPSPVVLATVKLLVFNRLPVFKLPTVIFPVIFEVVTAPPKVAPAVLVLFTSGSYFYI